MGRRGEKEEAGRPAAPKPSARRKQYLFFHFSFLSKNEKIQAGAHFSFFIFENPKKEGGEKEGGRKERGRERGRRKGKSGREEGGRSRE